MKNKMILADKDKNMNGLYDRVADAIRHAKHAVMSTVNIAMVDLNWRIGGILLKRGRMVRIGRSMVRGLSNNLLLG